MADGNEDLGEVKNVVEGVGEFDEGAAKLTIPQDRVLVLRDSMLDWHQA